MTSGKEIDHGEKPATPPDSGNTKEDMSKSNTQELGGSETKVENNADQEQHKRHIFDIFFEFSAPPNSAIEAFSTVRPVRDLVNAIVSTNAVHIL